MSKGLGCRVVGLGFSNFMFCVYDQDVIFMFGHRHTISHVRTLFGQLILWKGLMMGGEMTQKL
jgi:hypothetical protein